MVDLPLVRPVPTARTAQALLTNASHALRDSNLMRKRLLALRVKKVWSHQLMARCVRNALNLP